MNRYEKERQFLFNENIELLKKQKLSAAEQLKVDQNNCRMKELKIKSLEIEKDREVDFSKIPSSLLLKLRSL